MPKNRPGRIKYVTATKATTHGAPVIEDHFVGVAVKTQSPHWDTAFADLAAIAVDEEFSIITKGIVEVPITGIDGAGKGDPIYITDASNALGTSGGGGKSAYGRVAEVAGERGGRATHVRVDLDAKDSI